MHSNALTVHSFLIRSWTFCNYQTQQPVFIPLFNLISEKCTDSKVLMNKNVSKYKYKLEQLHFFNKCDTACLARHTHVSVAGQVNLLFSFSVNKLAAFSAVAAALAQVSRLLWSQLATKTGKA